MKHLLPHCLRLALSLLLFFYAQSPASAQVCTPNPAYTGHGVSPDTLVNMVEGCAGAPYSQTFTIRPAADTILFGFLFTINFLQINSVTGLPPGLTYACVPANCTFPGGSTGCAIVSGTTLSSSAGTWPITINATFQVFNGTFGTQTITYALTGYRIILNPAAAPSISPSGTPVVACNSGAVTLDAGAGFNSYAWSLNGSPIGGATSQTFAPVSSGLHSVVVTNANSCSGTDTVDVLVSAGIGFNSGTVDASCGNADGRAWANPVGNSPFTFNWNTVPPQTTDTISSLSAGNYTVVVTDSLGCSDSLTVSISNVGGPTLDTINFINPTCFGDTNGFAEIDHSNGTPNFTYLWNTGGTGMSISGLGAGLYTITVTDANNCLLVASITLTEPAELLCSTSSTDESEPGANDGTAEAIVSGGTPPYTYAWDNGGTTAIITGLTGGSYSVTVTDDAGCVVTNSVSVITEVINSFAAGHFSQVFPNPSAGYVVVQLYEASRSQMVRLSDAQGRIISETTFSGNSTALDLSQFPAGLYLVTVETGNGREHHRLVKE